MIIFLYPKFIQNGLVQKLTFFCPRMIIILSRKWAEGGYYFAMNPIPFLVVPYKTQDKFITSSLPSSVFPQTNSLGNGLFSDDTFTHLFFPFPLGLSSRFHI